MTDGEFVWRTDLSSYVTRYSIRLPEEFLKFMQEKQFKVPDVPRTRLLELSLAVGRMLNFRDNPGAGPQAKIRGKRGPGAAPMTARKDWRGD
ncbi:hypothetical protein GCM10020000_31120 [Streptomyces olivoverticillatus]